MARGRPGAAADDGEGDPAGAQGVLPLEQLLRQPPPWLDGGAPLRVLAEAYPRAWLCGLRTPAEARLRVPAAA